MILFGNLHSALTEPQLKILLSITGAPVKSVFVPRSPDGHNQGLCLVEYYSRAAAEKAFNHYKDTSYTVRYDFTGQKVGRDYTIPDTLGDAPRKSKALVPAIELKVKSMIKAAGP
jgi:RNA recognition motif. (a.k.a. RRM, RBD, or RNP domain)